MSQKKVKLYIDKDIYNYQYLTEEEYYEKNISTK